MYYCILAKRHNRLSSGKCILTGIEDMSLRLNNEHGHGGKFQAKNYIKFFIKEEEMKGFTAEMLWQQLKEKCNSANISNIKYMDHDKDWIDLRY